MIERIMQEQGKQNLESNSITQSFLNESFEAFVDTVLDLAAIWRRVQAMKLRHCSSNFESTVEQVSSLWKKIRLPGPAAT